MATSKQILLGVFRDKYAPFNPNTGKTGYYVTGTSTPASVGKSFDTNSIKGIRNVSEGGVTYGSFIYQLNDNSIPEEILVIQASGSIIALTNA
jgi:hypothetical protein